MIIKCGPFNRTQGKGRISSFGHMLDRKFHFNIFGNRLFDSKLNNDNRFLKALNLNKYY